MKAIKMIIVVVVMAVLAACGGGAGTDNSYVKPANEVRYAGFLPIEAVATEAKIMNDCGLYIVAYPTDPNMHDIASTYFIVDGTQEEIEKYMVVGHFISISPKQ